MHGQVVFCGGWSTEQWVEPVSALTVVIDLYELFKHMVALDLSSVVTILLSQCFTQAIHLIVSLLRLTCFLDIVLRPQVRTLRPSAG